MRLGRASLLARPDRRHGRRRLLGDRAGDAAGRARSDDPGHRAADDRVRPGAPGRRLLGGDRLRGGGRGQPRRSGASSATATDASSCSRSRSRCSSRPRRCAASPRACWMLVVARGDPGRGRRRADVAGPGRVGDLVSPRERGRYQGYIMAVFAVAAAVGPLLGGAAGRPRELALGVLREPARRGARARRACTSGCPRPRSRRTRTRLDRAGRGAAGRPPPAR